MEQSSLWPTDRFPAYTRIRGEVSVIFNLTALQKSDMKKEKGKGSEDLRLGSITHYHFAEILHQTNSLFKVPCSRILPLEYPLHNPTQPL